MNDRNRILLVDDERIITDTLTLIFQQNGYDVRSASSGAEALQSLDGWTPNLLLTDIVMLGLNGVELAIQVLRRAPACKAALISGQAATGATIYLLAKAKSQGYDFPVLFKPIHPAKLLAEVRRLLG